MYKYFITIIFFIIISSNLYSQAYINFIADTSCYGNYTKIINISYAKDSILQVNWDLNNDSIFNDASGDTVEFVFPSEGLHKTGLQIITKLFDTLIIYKEIKVNPSPVSNFYYINPCFGSYTYFIDSSFINSGKIIKHSWEINNNIFADTTGIIKFKFDTTGNYKVSLTVTGDNGCSSSSSKDINIHGKLSANFKYNRLCYHNETIFSDNSMLLNDSITDYYWCVGDSFYHTNTNTLEHRYTIRNLFKIYLAVKTEKGCIDTAFKTVQINPLPKYKYYFDGPTTFYEGNNLTVSVEGNFNTIYWSTKDTNNTITISNSGSFFFIITDTNNCSVKEKFEVTVLPRLEIIIPTIITPNGDGINDKFIIKNRECCDDFKIWIYNRNGNEVYSSINYNNDWDGKYNGNILPEGPYYYIIECCKNKTYKGSVNILK